ncbi:hypothetical protein AHAS_Ahas18G0171700 [Arachis hypogaea]
MRCLPESFTLPYPSLATLFDPLPTLRRATAASLIPSPTLCIFLPSASSSCRCLVGVVHQSRVCWPHPLVVVRFSFLLFYALLL